MLLLHTPTPPLDRYIECLWHSAGYAPSHDRERVLPTGTVELVFDLRDRRIQVFDDDRDTTGTFFRGAVVSGAHSRYFVLNTSQQAAVVGVHFRAGGAAPFLGVPLSGLEPLAYVVGAAIVVLIAVAATLAPARRAASVQPMAAMRVE